MTINEAGLSGQSESAVLAQVARGRRVVLTMNCRDFFDLHEVETVHAGIAGIYNGSDPHKNMTFAAIAASLANPFAADWDVAGQFVVLNV